MNRKQEIISALSGLLSDSNAVHRCLATQTLGRLNDMSSFQVLMDRLYDEDPDVCHDAIEALGELGDQGAVDILTLISNTADLGDIRVAALKSLIRIGGPEVAGLLLKVAGERDPSWDYLIEDTWDNYWDAQLLAVEALGRMGEERVVPLIRGILEDEYSQEISAQCITALKNCGPSGFELLMERLKAGQAIERRRIIEVMGQMEAPGVREALREALNDSDGEVRTIALEIIGDQLSADELVRLSRDSYPEVRAGVVDFLRLHSPVEHAKVWFRFLGDPSEDVRAATVAVLPGLMGRQSLTHLVKALEDDYQEVAVSAIEALGDLGGEAALAALMNETIRPGSAPLPRLTALEEMARYDDPEVRERLLLLLKDDDPAIRMASLEALSGEEGQRDKEFLFSVLRGEIVLEEQPEQPEQVEGGEEAETGEELSAHSDAAGSSEDQPGDEDLPAGQPAQTQAAQTQAAQTQAAQDQTVPEDPSEEQAEAAAESRPADMASSDGLEDDSRVLPADTGSGEEVAASPEGEDQADDGPEQKGPMSTIEAMTTEQEACEGQQDDPYEPDLTEDEKQLLSEYELKLSHNSELLRPRKVPPHLDVRLMAAKILRAEGVEESAAIMLDILGNADYLLLKEAADTFGEFKTSGAAEHLYEMLSQEHWEVRLAAARALGFLNHPGTPGAFRAKWPDRDGAVRREIILSLEGFEGQEVDSLLDEALEDNDPEVIKAAGLVLMRKGRKEHLRKMLSVMTQNPLHSWSGIGEALERSTQEEGVKELIAVLNDPAKKPLIPVTLRLLEEIALLS